MVLYYDILNMYFNNKFNNFKVPMGPFTLADFIGLDT